MFLLSLSSRLCNIVLWYHCAVACANGTICTECHATYYYRGSFKLRIPYVHIVSHVNAGQLIEKGKGISFSLRIDRRAAKIWRKSKDK